LRAPDGQVQAFPTGGRRVTVGPLDQAGIWTVADAANPDAVPLQRFACNVMSRTSSELRAPLDLKGSESAEDAGLVSGILGRPVWFFLVGLACLFLLIEWYLYQRRWIS
jgi:hypothetical protein